MQGDTSALVEIWLQIQQFGAGFVMFLLAYLFFSGRLVNGHVARQARLDSEAATRKAQEEQIALMKTRFDEMQTTWKERCEEVGRERNYYRTLALTNTRQTEQALQLAGDKLQGL